MSTSEYHHGALRATLVGLGFEMLEKAGVEGLSLRDLARQAGVSPNAPYRHFADKRALLTALATEGFRELTLDLRAASGEAVDRMGDAYVQFGVRKPQLYKLLFQDDKSLHRDDPVLIDAANECLQVLLDASGSPEHALALWSLVHGLVSLKICGVCEETGLPGHLPLAALMASLTFQ